MPRNLSQYLWDLKTAVAEIQHYTLGKSFADYENDGLLQAGMERKFEIIGEVFVQMSVHFPDALKGFTDVKKFIGFRNILTHQYQNIETTIVWGAIQSAIPVLKDEVVKQILSTKEK